MNVWDIAQEVRELGPWRTLYRTIWEARVRSGWMAWSARRPPDFESYLATGVSGLARRLPFTPPGQVAAAMSGHIPPGQLHRLCETADAAARGRIFSFGRWYADYGDPIDWHANPLCGGRWPDQAHWSHALRDADRVGDVKLTWEAARFPQAYYLARAATHAPAGAGRWGAALAGQMESFLQKNPFGRGVHWHSGLEVALRIMAWLFGHHVFGQDGAWPEAMGITLARAALEGGTHIDRHLEYARHAVYNDHLIGEALALYVLGALFPGAPGAGRWKRTGEAILDEQADKQIYPDGAHLQMSFNYQRAVMQLYLWAGRFSGGQELRPAWRRALERSLDFLLAHQNPDDGRLPNFGANDGAQFHILATCDYSDFRPVLQAASIATRGERLYEPGPWDEEAVWLFGPRSLDLPKRPPARSSASFAHTGYHVLRGRRPGDFATFRCGSVLDRFSQIDMLHVDVWWHGQNVLVDAGTYLYNGLEVWHRYFTRTACHNTLQIDGRDQMTHHRQFKCLHWTRAALTGFEDTPGWAVCSGEHYGYRRHPGGCVHHRAVLAVKDGLWVVIDRVTGTGPHRLRLHWLGGDFPHTYAPEDGRLTLHTPDGPFTVTVLDGSGRPAAGDVVAGRDHPPRGWQSRYYGEKIPVPSLAVTRDMTLPGTLVSVLCGGEPEVRVTGSHWEVCGGGKTVRFHEHGGEFRRINVAPARPGERP